MKDIAIDRKDFESKVQSKFQKGFFWKPDVFLVRTGERLAVVKDVGNKNLIFRWTLGLWLIHREWKIYSRLKRVPGIPRPLKRIDRFSFSVEYIPARPIQRGTSLPPSFFRDLEKILAGLHAQGVVHMDLRHKGHILVSETSRPVLVDFNTALRFENGWLRRFIFPFFKRIDHGGILKLKCRVTPSSLTPDEQKTLSRMNRIRRLWVFN